MTESTADVMARFTDQVVRHECLLVEWLACAFAEETGRWPHIVHDDEGWRCDGFNDHPPTDADWVNIMLLAASYRAETDIPASKAALVRTLEGTAFSWRWEERK